MNYGNSSAQSETFPGVVVISAAPHFLMLCESDSGKKQNSSGRWRFLCQQINGDVKIEIGDLEPGVSGERLDLLAVVRGLESLEQPSRVSLITTSRYVGRGIRHSLAIWRENNWMWEHFGVMRPIKNGDLWKRIDRALAHHEVECRVWSLNTPKTPPSRPKPLVSRSVENKRKQLVNWGNELVGRMASFGIAPVANYALR